MVAHASCFAVLYDTGELTIVESGTWKQANGDDLGYTEYHKVEGTSEPQELMYTLVTEMQNHV